MKKLKNPVLFLRRMALKLYNTYTRKKEPFKPIKKGQAGLYTCGPTVYNYAHIGNLRCYVFEDLLKRILLYDCFKVKHVMNITDVGHLTSDQDEGEDKMDLAVEREHKTPEQIAAFYAESFFSDLKKLNIIMPDIKCKATEHIQAMIDLIKRIEKNGYTYIGENGNVYFDTSRFKDYGKLARLKLEDQKAGARTDIDDNKKHPRDFVLWFSTTGSKFKGHLQKWSSPWGEGWPGWHIECSAMSIEYLGDNFDIHCGGIDHIPVHHTNEIAQSEAATGKKWVNYWLHNEFLILDKGKMAKSGGNFITLQTVMDKGFEPLDYRYMCLTAHYRSKLNFTWEALENAKSSFTTLKNIILEIKKDKTSNKTKDYDRYKKDFEKEINDDLNIPRALAVFWEVLRDKKLGSKEKTELIIDFDKVFGLGLKELKEEKVDVPKNILELVEKRENARKNKDWALADKIRNQIKEKGYSLDDTNEGVKVKKL
jgi:cysteinyl-tRNA synthetase